MGCQRNVTARTLMNMLAARTADSKTRGIFVASQTSAWSSQSAVATVSFLKTFIRFAPEPESQLASLSLFHMKIRRKLLMCALKGLMKKIIIMIETLQK